MSYTDQSNTPSAPRELPPEGKHLGRLIWWLDVGSHEDTYQGETKLKHSVKLGFELIGTAMSDGRPFMVWQNGTLSNGEWGPYIAKTSNLFKMLKKWTGKEDIKLKQVIAMVRDAHPCFVSVEHNTVDGKTYANIASIKSCGDEKVAAHKNEVLIFAPDIPKTDPVWDKIPGWAKKLAESCKELNGGLPPKGAAAPPSDNYDEDVPF